VRWIATYTLFLLLSACGESPSNTTETSDLNLDFDVNISVEKNETTIEFTLESSSGRRLRLSNSDRLRLYFKDDVFRFSKEGAGRYRATLPFVESGDYRVALERGSFIPAPDTVLRINNYPFLVVPQDRTVFNSNDRVELVWETRSQNGLVANATVYRLWKISTSFCADAEGLHVPDSELLYESVTAINASRFEAENVFDGAQARNTVELEDIINTTLYEGYAGATRIHSCEHDFQITRNSSRLTPAENLDDRSIQPVYLVGDSNLAGVMGSFVIDSNSFSVTIIQ